MAYTYSKLAETTVGAGGTSAITFDNIPQNYTDLVIKISARTNRASQSVDSLKLTFNGTATSFSNRGVGSDTAGGSAFSFTNAGSASIEDSVFTTATNATANTFGSGEIYIPNYTSSNSKSTSGDSTTENNSTQAYPLLTAGLWSNVTAISRITLAPLSGTSINQYSTATLYGIRVEL
jgi:hypothetical protein